jgi:hypothetical protein
VVPVVVVAAVAAVVVFGHDGLLLLIMLNQAQGTRCLTLAQSTPMILTLLQAVARGTPFEKLVVLDLEGLLRIFINSDEKVLLLNLLRLEMSWIRVTWEWFLLLDS